MGDLQRLIDEVMADLDAADSGFCVVSPAKYRALLAVVEAVTKELEDGCTHSNGDEIRAAMERAARGGGE